MTETIWTKPPTKYAGLLNPESQFFKDDFQSLSPEEKLEPVKWIELAGMKRGMAIGDTAERFLV